MKKFLVQNREILMNGMAAVFLAVSFVVSMIQINSVHEVYFDESKKNLRIAHWQLESGYRDALDHIIREYEKLHPEVAIHQVPITEKFYAQVVNTHLVGGTAPDLMEMGMSTMVSQDQYLQRYFEPMSGHVAKPNPYNAGTELEGVLWRETFIDGMRTAYRPSLQDYFGVPSSTFTQRIFYNRDLFRKVLGTDEPPQTFGQLLEVCRTIRQHAEQTGVLLVPIAGSKYNSPIFFERYQAAFLAGYLSELDTNLDGGIGGMEMYAGLESGVFGWDSPPNQAAFGLIRDLSNHFQKGFMAVGREQAAFLFVQENAAMITSGSWDAESLFRQADFEVGIFDFPMPAGDEPYADQVRGRTSEASTGTGNAYGIHRYSRNKDVAIDFLQFLTSKAMNQQFNRDINWIPAVIGARPTKELEVFMPNPEGYTGTLYWFWGGRSRQVYDGGLTAFVQGEIGLDEFGKNVVDALQDNDYGWTRAAQDEFEVGRNNVRLQEQLLGILNSDALFEQTYADHDRRFQEAMIRQVRADHGLNEYIHRFETELQGKLRME